MKRRFLLLYLDNIAGEYFIVFAIDDGDLIYEAQQEGNNLVAKSISILSADVAIEEVKWTSGSATSGETVELTWIVESLRARRHHKSGQLHEEIYSIYRLYF